MSSEVIGGFIAFAVMAVITFVGSFIFVKIFRDKHDSEWFPNLVAVTGLTFVLSCLSLVPVDIFLFSSTTDPKTGERVSWATQETIDSLVQTVTILYYVMYSVMMLFSFIIIPFAYFFYEEYELDITFKRRVFGALKYTIFTVIILIVLLLLGLFLSPGEPDPTNPSWYLSLFDSSGGVRAVCFLIACLTILGIFVFLTYTSYGMTAFPISLIKGKKEITQEEEQTLDELEVTQEKMRSIQAKYIGGRKISKQDKKELENLEKKERLLSKRSNVIEHSRNSWTQKCVRYTRPFQVILGCILMLLFLSIYISILLTSIDRVANSFCGSKCGFVLEYSKIFNPLDNAFLYMSRVFPIDYIFMVCIFFYFFSSTVSGIMRIGIRFLWVHLYSVKPKGTAPQGLLLTAILLMLALLYVNVTLLTIAPDYASFGYQKYCNITDPVDPTPCLNQPESILPCTIEAPDGKCTQTAFSTLVTRISVLTPFFGIAFMVGHWLFLLTALAGLIFSIFKKKQSMVQLNDESDTE